MDLPEQDQQCMICKMPTTYRIAIFLNQGVHIFVPLCVNHYPTLMELQDTSSDDFFEIKIDHTKLYEKGSKKAIIFLDDNQPTEPIESMRSWENA